MPQYTVTLKRNAAVTFSGVVVVTADTAQEAANEAENLLMQGVVDFEIVKDSEEFVDNAEITTVREVTP